MPSDRSVASTAAIVLPFHAAFNVASAMSSAPVSLAVRDPQQTPYCSASTDQQLSRVLSERWPHEVILDSLP